MTAPGLSCHAHPPSPTRRPSSPPPSTPASSRDRWGPSPRGGRPRELPCPSGDLLFLSVWGGAVERWGPSPLCYVLLGLSPLRAEGLVPGWSHHGAGGSLDLAVPWFFPSVKWKCGCCRPRGVSRTAGRWWALDPQLPLCPMSLSHAGHDRPLAWEGPLAQHGLGSPRSQSRAVGLRPTRPRGPW